MDIRNTILLIISLVDVLLALIIIIHNPKKVINISYSLTALWAGLWGLGIAMFRMSTSYDLQLFWNREFIITAALIASGFLHFSFVFGDQDLKINWKRLIFIYFPNIFIILLTLTPGVLIKDIFTRNWGNESILGWGYIYYGFYFAALWVWATYNLIKKYLTTVNKSLKIQIIYIYFGIGVSIIFGATFDLILILFGNYQFIWLGPYAMFFFIIMTTLAIARHQLLDIRVVATEVLAVFLGIVSFLQIFDVLNSSLLLRVIIFLVTCTISLLLIRSVIKDVERQEEMKLLNVKLRKAAQELKSANKELQRLDNAKSEFLSIASHQLRTPVTILRGYVSMLLEGSFGKMPKKIRDKIDVLRIATDRLLSLIEMLLDISRLEAGRLEFKIEPVDLTILAKNIVNDFQPKAKDKKLKLEVYVPKEGVPLALADEKKINEVFSNIVDNALKYTDLGEIIVGFHQEGQSVVFSCQDNGKGIEPRDLNRLFNKFERGTGMMQVHTEGVGLGLYFARIVVENMGGRIWAESAGKGQGSKFCVSLPLADKKMAMKAS